MAKDPAFLFYYQDFLVGTEFMTVEEVGIYIRMLCHMADKGKLSKQHMINICKTYDFTENLQSKFKIDEDGFYFNERLLAEVEKRRKYTESRRNNKLGKQHMINICKSYDKHMENENEININNNSSNNNKQINIKDKIVININDKHNNNDQLIQLWIKSFGRNPNQIELEETQKLTIKFGFEKIEIAFREAALRRIRSLQYLINNLDETGRLLTYEEKNKKQTAAQDEEYYKQPFMG